MKILFFCLFSIWAFARSVTLLKRPKGATVKIAFGSCAKFYWDDEIPIFNAIEKEKPDIFMWLGDAAYLDDQFIFYLYSKFPGVKKAEKRLNMTKNDPNYLKLRNSKTKIIGVWDNHDYGEDDADINFPYKEEMQRVFLDFLDEGKDSPRRQRKGIYESYEIYSGDFITKLILLDVRYHRDSSTQDVLGSEQWEWLESQLKEKFDVLLIASGSQILPDDRIFHSQWFGKSRDRLLRLLSGVESPLFLLSGDVHLGEFLEDPETNLSSEMHYFRIRKRNH